MSLDVQQYLNDSGGNFTESAPRPPVIGEENELQSNGGMSTRSSGSYKSHLSGKSHSSGKSVASHRSDVSHSPAATPRRSNLDKTLGSVSYLECMEAPLGFEPEGSAANSPPFTENTTPAYLKWAENLKFLLNDSDGVKLFKQFLDQEQCANTLDFWFACCGLKLVNAHENVKILNLAKLIYKKYIKAGQLKLQPDLKKTIIDRLRQEQVDQGIFDDAQKDIENSIQNDTYPLFLKSDIYVQYVQNGGESPKTSNNSSGSSSARPLSGPLATVPEGEELRPEDLSTTSTSMGPPLFLTASSLAATTKLRMKEHSRRPSEGRRLSERYHHPHSNRAPNPYHVHDVSYAPVSAQDSELQSSSDALTDDTMSLTDSSVDGREIPPYGTKAWKKHMKGVRRSAECNKNTDLNQTFIPRTERAPKDRNLAEKDPKRFADMLIERLDRVVEERLKLERMQERFQSMEQTDDESNDSMRGMPPPPIPPRQPMAAPASTIPLNALLTTLAEKDSGDDNAQSILEDHMSRVFDSSNGQTPSRSPGRHSPKSFSPDRSLDRSARWSAGNNAPGPSPNVSGTSLFQTSLTRPHNSSHHHSSKKSKDENRSMNNSVSFDSGMGPEDRLAAAGPGHHDNKHHKYVHHHHHHHHHVSKDSARAARQSGAPAAGPTPASAPPSSDQDAHRMHYYNSSPMLGYTAPNDSFNTSQNWEDSLGRGRSRDTKKTSAKKGSDSSSNLDSGLGDLSLHQMPSVHDPTHEKVLAWMMESEKMSTDKTYSTDNSDKASSHKRSQKSSSSGQQYKNTSGSSSKKPGQYRSGSQERAPMGELYAYSAAGVAVLPAQPLAQDPSMPLLTPPHPTTQLEEARRRLEQESKMSMLKSQSFCGTPTVKDRRAMPPPQLPAKHYKNIPHTQTAPLDLSSSEDLSSGSIKSESRRSNRKVSSSAPTTPQGVPGPVLVHPPTPQQADSTVVGYYFCGEPIPYRSTVPGRCVTLGQFKQLMSKRGVYRYYFKKACDEFDSGVVHEEYSDDSDVLPLWEGKVVGKVVKVE